jgi:hypothetical protein
LVVEIPPLFYKACMKCEIQWENKVAVIHPSCCIAIVAPSSQNCM